MSITTVPARVQEEVMRRSLLIGAAALCGALLVGSSGAAAVRGHATRSGWKPAISPKSYFGPNSSYRPSLNIDTRSHQSFDTDLTNVSRRTIGEIRASVRVPCTSGPPAIPIHASNRPTPTHAVPVKIAADGSFSLTLQAQYGPFQGVFHMSGRLRGQRGAGILSLDIDQPIPNPTPAGPTAIICHTGQVTWHVTWHNHAPSDG
jgi:hypothetical protein